MAVIYLRRYDDDTVKYVYRVNNFNQFGVRFSSPISPMPLPEEEDDRNILVKMEGNSTTMTVSWLMKNESTNLGSVHNGAPAPGSTKTIFEQVLFWQDFMIGTGITAAFDIGIGDGTEGSLDDAFPTPGFLYQKRGYLTNVDINTTEAEPNTFRCSVQFIVGDVISSYNADTPSEPLNFQGISGVSSGEIILSWDDPSDNGGTSVSKHNVLFKTGTNTWSRVQPANTANGVTLSGLTPGAEYVIKMNAENANGQGRYTPERKVIATV
jgi:hypothetical protein